MFINPVEILGLEVYDKAAFKKAKTRLYRTMELEDGVYDYHGNDLNRSDFENAFELVEDYFLYFQYLAKHTKLNKFLIDGKLYDSLDLGFNDRYLAVPISQKKLKSLISKQFATNISKFLSDLTLNPSEVKRAVEAVNSLVLPVDFSTAYSRLHSKLEALPGKVKALVLSHNTESAKFDSVRRVKNLVPVTYLNMLPSYFDSIKDDVAYALRNLSISLWNDNQPAPTAPRAVERLDILSGIAKDVLVHALGIKVGAATKAKLQEDLIDFSDIIANISKAKIEARVQGMARNSAGAFSSTSNNSGCMTIIVVALIIAGVIFS